MLPKELENSGVPRLNAHTPSFADLLKNSFEETNVLQEEGEKAATDIATGTVKDLHQAAIALGKAEGSMKLMLEIRNKAISAYREIIRTQM
ncbi:MAG: flagellar hook-basal body complex protein FliE [Helicobacteraceae bacterium]|nr:flagellar hook-basal body complex protein FliE [Helicobacteraceae bacterium]